MRPLKFRGRLTRPPAAIIGLALGLFLLSIWVGPAAAQADVVCPNPVPVVNENQCKTGTSSWQVSEYSQSLGGFTTQTSVDLGESVVLKVGRDAPVSSAKTVDIGVYRMGYYQNLGGRLVNSASKVAINNDYSCEPMDPDTGRVDCGNWKPTYTIPASAFPASGVYLAKLTASTGEETQVVFTVRDDERTPSSKLLYMLPIASYQAYNLFGGKSLYYGVDGPATASGTGRAVKVSFNRPFSQAGAQLNWFLGPDFELLSWLEEQGYDVSYTDDVQVQKNPSQLLEHDTAVVSGHSEYWSLSEFNGFLSARNAGVNIASFSANTAYWKVRYEDNSRTLVCYKTVEGGGSGGSGQVSDNDWGPDGVKGSADDALGLDGKAGTADDNPQNATTTFRDNGAPPGDPSAPAGGRVGPDMPENQLFGVMYVGDNGSHDWPVTVPPANLAGEFAGDPFWRNTGIPENDSTEIGERLVGWEWDTIPTQAQYLSRQPNNVVRLFATDVQTVSDNSWLQDEGRLRNTEPPPGQPGTVGAVKYTAASGAEVFASGTMDWARGLAGEADPRIEQATYNVLSEMGAQPQTPGEITLDPGGSNHAPNASFAISPNPSKSASTVSFDASSSTDLEGAIAKYEWDLDGNGSFETNTGSKATVTHSYSEEGVYETRLRVTDGGGATDLAVRTLTIINNQPPTASFSATPSEAIAGEAVAFNASASTDLDGTIAKYEWDLDGNGSYETNGGSSPTLSHTYPSPGAFNVGLRVTDNGGKTATATVPVAIASNGVSNYSPTVLSTPGLAHYWRMNETSGTAFADSVGSSDAAASGGPTLGVAGGIPFDADKAARFDGSDDAASAAVNLSGKTAVTIEFWMKWNIYANDDRLAMEFTNNFNETAGGFLVDPNSPQLGGTFGVGVGSGSSRNNAFFARPSAGQWHHYAFVLDTSAPGADEITPYVDGEPVAYSKLDSGNGGGFANSTLYMMSRAASGLFGAGDLDEVAIYDRALDATTIDEHFNSDSTNKRPLASFLAPASAKAGEAVAFNASASTDPDGTIAKYEWDLDGNGSYETDTGSTATVSHTYANGGNVKVGLRVTDNNGATGTTSHVIAVEGEPGPPEEEESSNYSPTVLGTPGLAHYWRLNETSGTAFADSVGGAPATASGGPTLGVPGGVPNDSDKAARFDGANDAASAAVDLSGKTAVTVEFWMKWNAWGNDDDLAMEFTNNFNEAPGGFLVDPNSPQLSGTFGVAIGAGSSRNNAFFARPSAGQWHHYAFVLDTTAPAAQQITPYIDGQPVAYTKLDSGTGALPFANSTLYMMSRAASGLFGAGDLDEVAIYDRALDAGTIDEHFNSDSANKRPHPSFLAPASAQVGEAVNFDASASSDPDGTIAKYEWDLDGNGSYETDSGNTATVSHTYAAAGNVKVGLRVTDNGGASATTTQTLSVGESAPEEEPAPASYAEGVLGTPGIVDYWRMGETSGSVLNDIAGPSPATLAGAPSLGVSGAVPDDPDKAVSFDGSDDAASAAVNLSGKTAVTVEFWLKWDSWSNDDDLAMELTNNFSEAPGGFLIDPNSAYGSFGVGIGIGASRNVALFARPSAGQWHHYAFVLDTNAPASEQVVPYVDGQPVAYTKAENGTGAPPFANAPLSFMSRAASGLFGAGDLDEVAIFDRALDATAIANNFQGIVTNRRPAAVLKAPVSAKAGEAVAFDASASNDPDGTIAKYEWDLDGNGSYETDTGTTASISHSYPAATTVKVGLRVSDGSGATATTTRLLAIEGEGGSEEEEEEGGGPGEQTSYADGVRGTPGLVDYWRMGEASGSILADEIGLNSAITAGEPALGATGAIFSDPDKAVSFDGSDDAASAAVDLSGKTAVTIEFWMKWDSWSNDDDLAMELTNNFSEAPGGFLIDPNSAYGSFGVGIGIGSSRNVALFARPSAGQWHHYAFVLDTNAPASEQIVPYVDGQPVAYTKAENGSGAPPFANAPLSFMSRAASGLFGAGDLDEVAIFDRALDATAVSGHFALSVHNFAPEASFSAAPNPASTGATVNFDASGSKDSDGTIAKYAWDLDGNGSYETDTGASPSASRAYATPGDRVIGLKVTDDSGSTATATRTLTIQNSPPSASFTATPNPVQTGDAVSFDAVASNDPDGTIAKYEWDLDGNGSYETDTGTTASATSSYATVGNRVIGLRVSDGNGATATTTRTLSVVNSPPAASFTVTPNPVLSGVAVSFDGAGSSDSDGTLTKYEWDLDGNGSYEVNSGVAATTSKSFSTPGTRTIGLRVTDNSGATATTTRTLEVQNRGPAASFTATPSTAPTGTAIAFDAAASADPDGTVAKYEWDFDGNGSYEVDAGATAATSHTFASPGVVQVGLRVTDNSGASATTTRTLTNQNRPPAASFTATPNPVETATPVAYSAAGSSDPDGTIAKYEWDLDGNGSYETNTGTTASASSSYATVGSRTVRLRVTDNEGVTATTTVSVSVVNHVPNASFTVTPNPVLSGSSAILNASASKDPDGTIAKYEWDLDGNGSYEVNGGGTAATIRSFPTAGVRDVGLRVTDNGGATATTTVSVTVTNRAPTASFTASPSSVPTGTNTTLNATASSDPDGTLAKYEWDLDGNGSYETDSGSTATVTTAYATAGNRTVGLRVTDNLGATATTTRTVTVTNRAPTASFTASPNPAAVGSTVTFNGSGSSDPDGTITKYEWDLDGNGSYEVNSGATATTTKTFTPAGEKTIRLRVTDNNGTTATVTATVTVRGPYNTAVSSTPGLIDYWRLGETSGTSLNDSVGNADATAKNNLSLGSAGNLTLDPDTAASFDGTNDNASAALNLSATPRLTIEFWLKWNTNANDDDLAFEFTSNFNNTNGGFLINPNSSTSGGRFEVALGRGTSRNNAYFTRPSAGVWHHYAFVLDPTAAAAQQILAYVDGSAVAIVKGSSGTGAGSFANSTLNFMSRNGSSLFGRGVLDEVAIYNQALTATQVSQHFAAR